MIQQIVAINLHLASLRTLALLERRGAAPTVQGVPVERDVERRKRDAAVALALALPTVVPSPL